jgi:hypothetical protein
VIQPNSNVHVYLLSFYSQNPWVYDFKSSTSTRYVHMYIHYRVLSIWIYEVWRHHYVMILWTIQRSVLKASKLRPENCMRKLVSKRIYQHLQRIRWSAPFVTWSRELSYFLAQGVTKQKHKISPNLEKGEKTTKNRTAERIWNNA